MFKWALLLLAAATACQPNTHQLREAEPEIHAIMDKHSHAEPGKAKVTHLDLTLDVDFKSKTLNGTAEWTFIAENSADEIVLDINGLNIIRIRTTTNPNVAIDTTPHREYFGQGLKIPITSEDQKVTIEYSTSESAGALQWLTPEQTLGGKHPFLFTQSQAILARTWVPCQDAPGIRFTYDAVVTVPEELLALMSATNPQTKNDRGRYRFTQANPIPSYLLALSVGDLKFVPVGERTGVYAEPAMLNKAAYEFADVEKMLLAAEELYGPYRWGRYDLLVLPPSFPFGGMENPELTFATPTIIAGDRSLTSLVAHELAHSWSGNLVTNATWDDFWLNEGFTVYLERRIMEHIYGADYAEMLAEIGHNDMLQTLEDFGVNHPDTRLKLDLEGRNPDDGVTDIAYEKGYALIRTLEKEMGRVNWDAFVNAYFSENAFKPMTTERFLVYMDEWFFNKGIPVGSFQSEWSEVDRWIYEPGLPGNYPPPSSVRFRAVEKQYGQWRDGLSATELSTKDWSAHEWLHFVRQIDSTVSTTEMARLDEVFNFTQTGNSEVLAAWLERAIIAGFDPAIPRVQTFLGSVGRRKFLVPLYTAMLKNEKYADLARSTYGKSRPLYHAVSVNTLDKLLEYGG